MHEMTLVCSHEGTNEFICPICGREVLIEFYPGHKTVIVAGDETAGHSGWIGEMEEEVE